MRLRGLGISLDSVMSGTNLKCQNIPSSHVAIFQIYKLKRQRPFTDRYLQLMEGNKSMHFGLVTMAISITALFHLQASTTTIRGPLVQH